MHQAGPRSKPSPAVREARESLWRFSTRFSGHWWERIRGGEDDRSALTYLTVSVDELTNTPKISGKVFSLAGERLADWRTVTSGVLLSERPQQVHYRWEGEHQDAHGPDVRRPRRHLDPSLLTIEFAAWALALEGEGGATELLAMAGHPDFSIRSKVAIGFERLGRRARWGVPALIRALKDEPVRYVAECLIRTLGRIGGREATRALEHIAETNRELAATARKALTESERKGERA